MECVRARPSEPAPMSTTGARDIAAMAHTSPTLAEAPLETKFSRHICTLPTATPYLPATPRTLICPCCAVLPCVLLSLCRVRALLLCPSAYQAMLAVDKCP